MGLEPRGRADQGQPVANPIGKESLARPKPKVKSFEIDKRLIYGAWEKVRANRGAPGVDAVSIAEFGERERDNLYLLWNRMSSGVAIQPEWRHAGSAAGFGSRDVGACSSRVGVRVAGICGAGCVLVVVTGVRLRAGARVGR